MCLFTHTRILFFILKKNLSLGDGRYFSSIHKQIPLPPKYQSVTYNNYVIPNLCKIIIQRLSDRMTSLHKIEQNSFRLLLYVGGVCGILREQYRKDLFLKKAGISDCNRREISIHFIGSIFYYCPLYGCQCGTTSF